MAANPGSRKKSELTYIWRASRITEIRPTHLWVDAAPKICRKLSSRLQSFLVSRIFQHRIPNIKKCRFHLRRSFNTQRSKFCGLRRPSRTVDRLFRSALSHQNRTEISKKEKARNNPDNVARTRGGMRRRSGGIEMNICLGKGRKSRAWASNAMMV